MFKKILLCTFIIALSHSLRLFSHQKQHDQFVVQTKTPRYYFNEAENKSNCTLNGMCDGQRKCSFEGKCTGKARPNKSQNYFFDEKLTSSRCPVPGDYNYPIADYFCSGLKTCKDGNCV